MSEPKNITRDFSHLKKPASIALNAEVEEKLIALLEGDLNDEEAFAWERKIAVYPEVKNEYHLFKQTKLSSPKQVYQGKQFLYKKGKGIVIPFYFNRWLAAACLLCISSLFWFLFEPIQETKQVVLRQQSENLADISQQNNESMNEFVSLGKSNKSEKKKTKRITKLNHSNRVKEQVGLIVSTNKIAESIGLPKKSIGLDLKQKDILTLSAQKEASVQKKNNYLSPKEWFLEKLKKQIPETGIVVQHKSDAEQNSQKLLIASRYFSYEKVSYQKQN